jgi:hypothetical protein
MAKKAKAAKKHIRNAQPAAAPQAQPEAPVQPMAQAIREVFVVTGGTADKPVRENAASYPPVTAEEVTRYGNDRKRVVVGLAMNLLGGIALSRDVINKDGAVWANRSLRTDKLAFFKILESGLTQAQLVDSWNQTLKDRKRYDAPTLQALSKAARAFKILSGTLEPRMSPMEKFARDCIAILNDRTLTDAERLRVIRSKLTEKANYDSERPAQPALAA